MVAGTGFLLALLPAGAYAGAWTQPQGEGFARLTYERYRTTEKFAPSGERVSLAGNLDAEFVRQSVHQYVEVGVLERLTALGNFYYDFLSYGQSDLRTPLTKSGFSDQEIGLRYAALREPVVLAVQASLRFPAGYETESPPPPAAQPPRLGSGAWGTEARLAAGKGFGHRWSQGFVNAEVGYNTRWSGFADQLKIEVIVGYKGLPRVELQPAWRYTKTLGEVSPNPELTNPLADSVFDLHRLELLAVVRIWRWFHVEGSGFAHVAGRNVGAGSGVEFGVRGVWPEP